MIVKKRTSSMFLCRYQGIHRLAAATTGSGSAVPGSLWLL
jgi:hypothetical protein